MTNQPRLSPTQIKAFQRCPRLYAYTYPGGERQPAGPGAQLGSDVHDAFEAMVRGDHEWNAYLQAHGAGKHADIALAVYSELCEHFYENPDEVEAWVEIDGLRGRVDLLWHSGLVVDLKTMSSFRYALRAEQLPHDVQMVAYGLAVAREYGLDSVTLVHLQVKTQGAYETRWVEADVTRSELEQRWAELEPVREAITSVWAEWPEVPAPLEGAPQHPSCRAYGGCPFASRCGERFAIPEEKPVIGLLETLFNCLCEEDKGTFVEIAGDTNFWLWPSHDVEKAHDLLTQWSKAPSIEEAEQWQSLAPWLFHDAPLHPSNRASVVEQARSWAIDLVGEQPSIEAYRQALQAGATEQPVNPPDAPPNKAIDPLDVPIDTVDGVGATLAGRLKDERGIDSVRAYVDAPAPPTDVRGWTDAKHEAVWAYAMERSGSDLEGLARREAPATEQQPVSLEEHILGLMRDDLIAPADVRDCAYALGMVLASDAAREEGKRIACRRLLAAKDAREIRSLAEAYSFL